VSFAAGTVRTDAEVRLIGLIAELEGFDAQPASDARYWVVSTEISMPPKNRRWVVIGAPDGPLDPDAISAGIDSSTDSWTISCGIACTAENDPVKAKRDVEAALNAIADLLAGNPLLVSPHAEPVHLGTNNARVTQFDGPHFAEIPGEAPLAWIDFDIAISADIERNRP
jgi:hypothetical protein